MSLLFLRNKGSYKLGLCASLHVRLIGFKQVVAGLRQPKIVHNVQDEEGDHVCWPILIVETGPATNQSA